MIAALESRRDECLAQIRENGARVARLLGRMSDRACRDEAAALLRHNAALLAELANLDARLVVIDRAERN